MTEKKQSPSALSDRIKARPKKEGILRGMHPSVLRKYFAFDTLLARPNKNAPGMFVLKGGYLMELRVVGRRSTVDLDFLMRMKKIFANFESMAAFMRRSLSDATEEPVDQDDAVFAFSFGEPSREIDGGGGGARFPAKLLLGGKIFEEFHVDVAKEDIEARLSPVTKTPSIPPNEGKPFSFEGISVEQHFAEKVHAYTRPRDGGNSRIKDIVDLYLLVKLGLDPAVAAAVLREVFDYWGTHDVPREMPDPPSAWEGGFASMVAEMGLDIGLRDAHRLVAVF